MTMKGDYGLALANGGGIRPLSINSNATVWPRRYGAGSEAARERRQAVILPPGHFMPSGSTPDAPNLACIRARQPNT